MTPLGNSNLANRRLYGEMSNSSLLAISVDIEDWYHTIAVTGSSFAKYESVDAFFGQWSGRYDYLTEPTHRTLALLEELAIKATFFVVADVIVNYPGLVQCIAEAGHEIACHDLHHACGIDPKSKRPFRSPGRYLEDVRVAKSILENATGQEVIGYRAPSGYVAGWMIDVLDDLGFRYDSSVCINSFFSKMDVKPKGVQTRPYYPARNSLEPGPKRGIIELPWPYLDLLGLKLPTASGPFLRFFGAGYIMAGLRQSLCRGDTIFYFHPFDISEEKTPAPFSWHRPFFWSGAGGRVFQNIKHILTALQGEAQLVSCRDVWARWHQLLEPDSSSAAGAESKVPDGRQK